MKVNGVQNKFCFSKYLFYLLELVNLINSSNSIIVCNPTLNETPKVTQGNPKSQWNRSSDRSFLYYGIHDILEKNNNVMTILIKFYKV